LETKKTVGLERRQDAKRYRQQAHGQAL